MTLPVRLPALLILLSVNAQAWAGTSSVRLSYERGAGAEGCPDEQHLKDAVAARLGYDPFAEWGDRTVQAKVESKNGVERVGTVHMLASDGKVLGSLKRSSKATDCSELAAAMELAITIAIDPLVLSRPEPPPPPPPPPAKPEVEARPPPPPNLGEVRTVEAEAPPPVPTRRIPTEISVLAGPIVFTGAPRIGVGLNLGLELKWEQFSLGLEGRADLPAGTDVGRGGAVTTWAAGGALCRVFGGRCWVSVDWGLLVFKAGTPPTFLARNRP
ncbi:MAG: hypothetical protein ACT4TC_16520 [Myxococcaceae bacterium]